MATEELGLGVAVSGFRQFMSQMKGMDDAIGGTGKKWEGLSGLASGAGKVLAGVAAVGIAAVAAAATAAVAGVGALAIGLGKLALEAAPLEGIGTAFEVMSERAGLSLESLRTASAGTIADFELMRMANVALTGAGEELGTAFGEDLPKLMEIARASARATGQSVEFMFNSLVTGVKRTAPMLIDNTGLQLKLGEANKALAAALGKTVEELTGEERQIALLNATILAGEQMVADFGSGHATAAEEIAAFRATIQNTKNMIGLAFLPALQALLEPLAEIASDVGPELIAWAQEAGEWLGENLPTAIATLRQWWTETWPVIRTALTNAWNTIEPILRTVIQWLSDDAPSALDDIRQSWATAWEHIRAVTADAVSTIQAIIQPFLDILQSWWSEHGDSVMVIVNVLWDGLKATFQMAIGVISTVVSTALTLWDSFWSTHGQTIMLIVSTMWENIKTVFSTAMAVLGALVDAFAAAIEGDWQAFGENLQGAWTALWEGIREIVGRIGATIVTVIATLVQSIITKFTEVDWAALGRSLIDSITAGIRAAIAGLVAAAAAAAQAALDALNDIFGSGSRSEVLYELGINLVASLIEGIQAQAGDVQAVIEGLFDVGGILGGLGTAAAARWMAPVKERVKALQESVRYTEDLLKQEDLSHEHRVLHTAFLIKAKAALFDEQAKLNAMEREALALEKQRQDLAFLQEQAKLLELIREHGLDAGAIMEGIELGIDADVGAIVRAMTVAMRAIVEQAEAELLISSPSAVFARIGAQMMAGMEAGIASMVPAVQLQMQMAVQPFALPGRSPAPVTATNEYHYHLAPTSVMRDGGLRMEFQAMEMASR